MGQCGKFGYALRVTAANLAMRYGPLRRIWYTLWATVQNEAVQ
jgi:hypothetical protein